MSRPVDVVDVNEVRSDESIKSAEQSVLDFFAAVENKDYDTLRRVSVNKRMSDEVQRATIELQHEQGLLAEQPPTILSSEMCDQDTVMVKVSYILAGEERIMIYPVMLVDKRWIVNVGDAVNPADGDVVWVEGIPVSDSGVEAPSSRQ
ncbi:MAG: hypothetical protein RQM92_05990 [Candidatus Syntrophopropionicum ammoniitolerans]